MLKMRAPAGSCGISLAGRPIEVDDDGSAMVHPSDVAAATTHGFTPWTAPELAEVDTSKMTRAQLIERMVVMARRQAAERSDEELREAVAHMEEAFKTRKPEEMPRGEAEELRGRLPTMPRAEMQAFLRSRRVAFVGATGDEKLRDMIGAELARSLAAE